MMGLVAVIERVLDRLRPNVLIIAGMVTFLIVDYGDKLIDKLPNGVSESVLTGLIGVGIGGLIAAMMRMFESPSVPADVHERMVNRKNDTRGDD